ncbi:MAG: endonuclease/exonuclease/phosphatase family protein [Prevotella sp.]|nr:endonuclease/exonuclease/phosphatase family protein [Prevotella sp.]
MARLAVYKYLAFMMLVVTALVTVFTLAGLIGGYFAPAEGNTALAMLVYVLPLLVAANVVLIIYWVLRRKWIWGCMPVATLLLSLPYIGTFYRPDLLASKPEGKTTLTIATYNVARFANEVSPFRSESILAEMRHQQVEILCLQEFRNQSGDHSNIERYQQYYPYKAVGQDDMVIFSRFPILDSQTISFGQGTNNSAMWAELNVRGRRLRVINVHLQTTGINRSMRLAQKASYQGQKVESNRLLRLIYGNYTQGMAIRGEQAKMVAAVRDESQLPCILCGDFNDVPYSYVYRTLKGDMVDGFQECGTGYMHTFTGKKSVRIDYIFHDEQLKGQTYYKQNLSFSDHLPVYMKIGF